MVTQSVCAGSSTSPAALRKSESGYGQEAGFDPYKKGLTAIGQLNITHGKLEPLFPNLPYKGFGFQRIAFDERTGDIETRFRHAERMNDDVNPNDPVDENVNNPRFDSPIDSSNIRWNGDGDGNGNGNGSRGGRRSGNFPGMNRGLSRSKTLGIKRSIPSGGASGDTFGKFDYEQKYPEDPYGEEAGEYARVWLTYLDETEQYDRDKIDGWKDTIDVLMVLAGLFSAVVTTLVVQSIQNLQIDYTQVSASLLFELIQIQRAVANGESAESVSASSINPNTPFNPTVTDTIVNGLWFTSLTLALATALLAVLTKQWLYQYSSLTFGTPRERCRLRQFRYQGLEIWKVAIIIELLPVLMHIALALFLAGLVIFLIPLNLEIAWTVGVITGIAYISYVLSVFLPIWDPQCPYTIPLTIYLRDFGRFIQYGWHSLINLGISYESMGPAERKVRTVTLKHLARLTKPDSIVLPLRRLYRYCYMALRNFLRRLKKLKSLIITHLRLRLHHSPPPELHLQNHREHEKKVVQQGGILIDANAISWLSSVSSNPSVQRITAQSIGGLPYGINGNLLTIEEEIVYEFIDEFVNVPKYSAIQVATLRRLILSWLHYDNKIIDDDLIWFPDPPKIRPHEPEFAELCRFLKSDPTDTLIQCMDGDKQGLSWPLVVWSYLFRNAEHRSALALALLTWPPAESLFVWDDRKVTPISGKEDLTLSELSFRHPHIVGKWIFTYLCKYFDVQLDRKHSEFVFLGEVHYTRYSLFRTIYRALAQPHTASDFSRWNPFLIKISLLYLVRNFETYVTAHELDLDDYGELAKAFERDIIWSESFFDDESVVPQSRAHAFQIYNVLQKTRTMTEPLQEQTIYCIYNYLVRPNASRWTPPVESRNTALHLLTGMTLPRFCKFLCTLPDPRLALILFHARQGMTRSHAETFLSVYKIASRNSSSRLYYILYDPSVLEELCKGLAIADCPHYLLRIARLDPSNSNWRDCYKRLLNSIREELESSVMYSRDDVPPHYQEHRKEWLLLYSLCYHLRPILQVDLSGDEFSLQKLSDIFPQHSPDRISKLNNLVLQQRETYLFRLSQFFDSIENQLIKTLNPTSCVDGGWDDDSLGQTPV
ncbi:hypothetical protein Clacol_007181 [Clathrus columnatus]|uniref:DUF6535 domain-containing protein n=1 Tax=Clathrus columnatus TaxID=1419009 RepID=A0AAV5AIH3_9AGAM|nr:hypothetical protein Clacol_007181 [Clathrus columnatus]